MVHDGGLLNGVVLFIKSIPFSRGLSDLGVEPGSPALQVDFLPSYQQSPKSSTSIPNIIKVIYSLQMITGKCFTITNLANMFFPVSVPKASQLQVYLHLQRTQCSFSRLPTGNLSSPVITNYL